MKKRNKKRARHKTVEPWIDEISFAENAATVLQSSTWSTGEHGELKIVRKYKHFPVIEMRKKP